MRTGFTKPLLNRPYALDLWTKDDKSVEQELGFLHNLDVARAFWEAAHRFEARGSP